MNDECELPMGSSREMGDSKSGLQKFWRRVTDYPCSDYFAAAVVSKAWQPRQIRLSAGRSFNLQGNGNDYDYAAPAIVSIIVMNEV
ncbi:hypothetical protein E4U60_000188 [Claviceps pazoutovae]|uniref:Uncharacterized protein n=1 Tax=Claviceps pazoutovae TaxID=1649127 RepID=A0A9P7ME05_9HYPO|nr:hypothetical protein E4U60_000188 [Claviceps pazoutovae]